jgi:hypothetical protein
MLLFASDAQARHDCDEGHYRIDNPSISVDPPTSCLNLEIVGEMKDCEHAQLRIDNQCDALLKMLDDTQAYCELTGDGSTSECQVIGSGIVGYVNLPWRKVVNTDERVEHRYDIQAQNGQTFIFVSWESTRLDSPDGEGDGDGGGGDDDSACSTLPLGRPVSAAFTVLFFVMGFVGLRRRRRQRV